MKDDSDEGDEPLDDRDITLPGAERSPHGNAKPDFAFSDLAPRGVLLGLPSRTPPPPPRPKGAPSIVPSATPSDAGNDASPKPAEAATLELTEETKANETPPVRKVELLRTSNADLPAPLPSFPFDKPPSSAPARGRNGALATIRPLPPPSLPPRSEAAPTSIGTLERRPRTARRPRALSGRARKVTDEQGDDLPVDALTTPPPSAVRTSASSLEDAPLPQPKRGGAPSAAWLLVVALAGVGGYAIGHYNGIVETQATRPHGAATARARNEPAGEPRLADTAASPGAAPTDSAAAEPESHPTTDASADAAPTTSADASASAAPSATASAAPSATAKTAITASPTDVSKTPPSKPTDQPRETAKPLSTAEPSAPSTGIDTGAMAGAVAGAAGAASGCPTDTDGGVSVSITFLPSGSASVSSSGSLAGTAAAACVEGKFAGLHVPPFQGDPVTTFKSITLKAR